MLGDVLQEVHDEPFVLNVIPKFSFPFQVVRGTGIGTGASGGGIRAATCNPQLHGVTVPQVAALECSHSLRAPSK